MFIFILAVGAFYGSIKAMSAAGTAVAASIPLGLAMNKSRLERDQRLGLKTLYQKDQERMAAEAKKNGKQFIPDEMEDLTEVIFEKETFPERMRHLCSYQWLLTKTEFFMLLSMMNLEMLNNKEGPFENATRDLCRKHNMDYEELTFYAKHLGINTVNYEHLIWLSKNRYSDPAIQKDLAKQKASSSR